MSSIIKQLGKIDKSLTKFEIEELATQDIKQISQNEQYDLLKVLIEFRRYSVYLNKLIDEIKVPAIEKAKLMGERKFDYAGAEVIVSKRTIYDYSADKTWSELYDNIIDIKEQLKKHQDLLKELDNNATKILDRETGELINLTPPSKNDEDTIIIRLTNKM